MNDNGLMNNGLVKLNDSFQNGNNQVRNGVTGEGQWPSKKDESRINEDMENESDKQTMTIQASSQVGQKRSLEQSREPLVQWKRFMPLQSLKVLLVEYDDSTRQVVSALLRNCSYEGL